MDALNEAVEQVNETEVRLNIVIAKSKMDRLKIEAIRSNQTLREIVTELIDKRLEKETP